MTKEKIVDDDVVTAKKLKAVLWNTLQGLKSGDVSVEYADAIARQSREIVNVINSERVILSQHTMMTDSLIKYVNE